MAFPKGAASGEKPYFPHLAAGETIAIFTQAPGFVTDTIAAAVPEPKAAGIGQRAVKGIVVLKAVTAEQVALTTIYRMGAQTLVRQIPANDFMWGWFCGDRCRQNRTWRKIRAC